MREKTTFIYFFYFKHNYIQRIIFFMLLTNPNFTKEKTCKTENSKIFKDISKCRTRWRHKSSNCLTCAQMYEDVCQFKSRTKAYRIDFTANKRKSRLIKQ